LQRLVYVAAFLTLAHWIFLEYGLGAALVHFLPLAALEGYRLFRTAQPSKALADA
jgi:sulfoxide reductase heme-binding subunit YedZ